MRPSEILARVRCAVVALDSESAMGGAKSAIGGAMSAIGGAVSPQGIGFV